LPTARPSAAELVSHPCPGQSPENCKTDVVVVVVVVSKKE